MRIGIDVFLVGLAESVVECTVELLVQVWQCQIASLQCLFNVCKPLIRVVVEPNQEDIDGVCVSPVFPVHKKLTCVQPICHGSCLLLTILALLAGRWG